MKNVKKGRIKFVGAAHYKPDGSHKLIPYNETYQDLEDKYRCWTSEEVVDKLLFLAYNRSNDQDFGRLVRRELLKFESKRHDY